MSRRKPINHRKDINDESQPHPFGTVTLDAKGYPDPKAIETCFDKSWQLPDMERVK